MPGRTKRLSNVRSSALDDRPVIRLVLALLCSSLVSIGLYAYGAWRNQSLLYEYLVWNLFLAWVPLLFAAIVIKLLRRRAWSNWLTMLFSFLWLSFLPNSFYLITDYVHLREIERVDILFDVVMFTSFIFTGLVVGFLSLFLVHRELVTRVGRRTSYWLVGLVLFVCSYAIYLGRDLRWNTWDILANPAGILFDVSDRLIKIGHEPQMVLTTLSFFILLSTLYAILWEAVRVIRDLEA
ncbi:MAG: hypothetical protein JWM37_189 [Candidatus Saccharibacteria bacterium]|nr:hypothetical protein [Candidatus Saccharibacteria bacterium]